MNTIHPQTSKPFEDNAKDDILPEIEFCGTKCKRVDIAFDENNKSNLKGEARVTRGHGARSRMTYQVYHIGIVSSEMTIIKRNYFNYSRREFARRRRLVQSL